MPEALSMLSDPRNGHVGRRWLLHWLDAPLPIAMRLTGHGMGDKYRFSTDRTREAAE